MTHGSTAFGDDVAHYMAQIRRIPLIPRAEERALALRYQATQDPALAHRLVAANLRLVVKIAYDYHPQGLTRLDLIQEGNRGLVMGVKRYDPTRGVKLSTFAAWWIRAYMLRAMLDNARLVRLGTTQAQRRIFFGLEKTLAKLQRLGVEPSDEALAEALRVPLAELMVMRQRLGYSEVSLQSPASPDEERPLEEVLPSTSVDVEERLELDQVRTWVRAFGESLPEGLERTLYLERMLAEEPLTLSQMGDRFGLSRERIRQIEVGLVARLRTYLVRKGLADLGDVHLVTHEEMCR